MNLTRRFVVPIAAFGAGYMTGLGVSAALGDWLIAFVPGLDKVHKWTQKKDPGMWLGLVIGGAIIIAGGLVMGALIRGFLGENFLGSLIATAIAAFAIGAGVRGIVGGFSPLTKVSDAMKSA
jgi:hypothetical protein